MSYQEFILFLYTTGKEYVTVLRLHDAVTDTKLAQVSLSIAMSFNFNSCRAVSV